MSIMVVQRDRTQLFDMVVTQVDPASGLTVPVDLTGKDIVFAVKKNYADADPPLIKKSLLGGGITSPVPTSGKAILELDPADTTPLANVKLGGYVWDAKLVDGANFYPIDNGNFLLEGNVAT